MTGERLDAAVHFMGLHDAHAELWLLSTTNKNTDRDTIADLQKRVTQLQGRYRLRLYNATTFETAGGLHAHIIFIGIAALAEQLKASKRFGEIIDVRRVTDPQGLVKYLAKERDRRPWWRRIAAK
jgi:hypothetical protein